MNKHEDMDILVSKQRELMEAVPHPLRDDAFERMDAARELISNLLLYLNSTGHKPWRPKPLHREVQLAHLLSVGDKLDKLGKLHLQFKKQSQNSSDVIGRRLLVSTFGAIEEAIEFYDSWFGSVVDDMAEDSPTKKQILIQDRKDMLEELTDELFFFLERMILVGFTWDEVIQEYHRKWGVNMERYRRGKEGDYSWDDRAKKEKL
ncbi:MAG: hypothetical protein PHZ19_08900 [Candidatus Thermoplasmatota archaeon]|nr:hypothetical protein [Candidatus Thermoplasmatota archaeon]